MINKCNVSCCFVSTDIFSVHFKISEQEIIWKGQGMNVGTSSRPNSRRCYLFILNQWQTGDNLTVSPKMIELISGESNRFIDFFVAPTNSLFHLLYKEVNRSLDAAVMLFRMKLGFVRLYDNWQDFFYIKIYWPKVTSSKNSANAMKQKKHLFHEQKKTYLT